MNTKNPQRLQRKIKELHQNWELLGDILAKLNRERILETRADEKMRLEQKIADIEAERQQVEQQLDELEAQVGTDDTREDAVSRKPEPHHKPPQPAETIPGQHKKKQPRKTPKPQKAEEAPVIHLRSEPLTVSREPAVPGVGEVAEERPARGSQEPSEADRGIGAAEHFHPLDHLAARQNAVNARLSLSRSIPCACSPASKLAMSS